MALSHITSQQRHDFFVALSFVSGSLRRLPSSLGWRAELKQQNWSYFGVIFFGKKSPTHRDVHGWSVSMFFFSTAINICIDCTNYPVLDSFERPALKKILNMHFDWIEFGRFWRADLLTFPCPCLGFFHHYDAGMVRFLWCLIFRVSELLDDFELILLLFFWWFLIIFLLTVLE